VILEIRQFPCLEDNYGFLAHDRGSNATWCIDTPDPTVILAELDKAGWALTAILNTHHHADHVGGNLALKEATGCQVIGPAKHAKSIPGLDRAVQEGDLIGFSGEQMTVLDIPGHTRGHVAYWCREAKAVFVGDTLFPLGCGRLFGGSVEQLHQSLCRLADLPGSTLVYSAHEYALGNLRFALSVDPANAALARRGAEIRLQRERGLATVPSTIEIERATNPFLRAWAPALAERLGLTGADAATVLGALRAGKDAFSAGPSAPMNEITMNAKTGSEA
jgi:hydroxyacylglutathione hydrolase